MENERERNEERERRWRIIEVERKIAGGDRGRGQGSQRSSKRSTAKAT